MNRPKKLSDRLPIDMIDFARLEHESRKYLYAGFLVGIMIHIAAGLLITWDSTIIPPSKTAVISIPVSLFYLPPQIRNPYDSWVYIPKKRDYLKKMVGSVPGLHTPAGPQPETHPRAQEYAPDIEPLLSKIGEHETDSALFDSLLADSPRFLVPDTIIPLKNNVFVDTGTYKSQVVIPPDDKTAIQGYVKIALGTAVSLIPPAYLQSAARNLAEALEYHTNIHAEYDHFAWVNRPPKKESLQTAIFDTEATYRTEAKAIYENPFNRLRQYPFMYFTSDHTFTLGETETARLYHYLANGGFVILDNGLPDFGAESIPKALISMLYETINSTLVTCRSKNLEFRHLATVKTLPHTHPIYHSFFDFDSGPPPSTCATIPENEIVGFYFHDRLVGVYCPQGYGRSWSDRKNKDQLRMGVNLVVYALTRPQGTLLVDCEKERLYWRDRSSGPIRSW